MKLESKVAFITGAAQGIGKEIAFALAAEGADIVIADMNETAGNITAGEITQKFGRQSIVLKLDVSKPAECEDVVKKILDRFQKIDILINNAGVTRDGLLVRMSEEDWDFVLSINLKGVFNCTKACARVMMKQRSGRIVNIASVVGQMGNAGQINYSASKGGVIAMTKTTARELASRGVLVNAVAPGYIRTAMTDKLSEDVKEQLLKIVPLGRLGEAAEVAK
ncbi:MAG: SDR family NAD(P)-dependent oxidoreductase, partial [Elusimicrobiota bacterium]